MTWVRGCCKPAMLVLLESFSRREDSPSRGQPTVVAVPCSRHALWFLEGEVVAMTLVVGWGECKGAMQKFAVVGV